MAPVEYHAEAKATRWDDFLQKIFSNNQNVIAFMKRLLGYFLTGSVREQILPIFWGGGSNGKSTLIGTVLAVLGQDYGIKAAADLIITKRADSHPTERADLFGKRLAVCIETEENRRLAESLVKDLTGGDRLRARRMREDNWEFDPTHKLVLCTNHKPEIR